MHEGHETAIFVLSGEVDTFYGANLQHRVTTKAGDMFYIPAGVPHLPVNRSTTEPATAVIASGLKEGETVVVDGVQRVRPGIVVNPAPAHQPPAIAAQAPRT